MGIALKALGVPREHLVVTTKIYWGPDKGEWVCGQKNRKGLSKKHIFEGMRNSLKRLQLDYVDVVYCHRPDHFTPLLETCRAMNALIEEGYAFYWGTSEWTAAKIAKAMEICDRENLIRPVVE